MTQAAEQCRSFVEAEFPGVRISRRSCRDTDAGGISQHSAYQPGDYDSNALDIMGGPHGWTWDQNVALIQEIVDRLTPKLHEWSIRKILWQVPPHYGHAHIDFYPMIDIHRWCSTRNVEPPWKYSDGHTERHFDPTPENGLYNGEDGMTYIQWANEWIQQVSDEDLERMDDANLFNGEWEVWATLRDVGLENRNTEQRREVARFRTAVEVGGWVSQSEAT